MRETKSTYPYSLSDPSFDFTHEEDVLLLRKIEAKKGIHLTSGELACVFQLHCTAGTIQEVCAYIPSIFDYLSKMQEHQENPNRAPIWSQFIDWVNLYQDELQALNRYELCVSEIRRFIQNTLASTYQIPQDIGQLLELKELLYDYWRLHTIDEEERHNSFRLLINNPQQYAIVLLLIYDGSRTDQDDFYLYKEMIDLYLTEDYMRSIMELCLDQALLSDNYAEYILRHLEWVELGIQM